jgi:hypothetical protein
MNAEETLIPYCPKCETLATDMLDEHKKHGVLVGIRGDILNDALKRLVADLRRTGRLIPVGK